MAVKFAQLQQIADYIASADYAAAAAAARSIARSDNAGIHWVRDMKKLAAVLDAAADGRATSKFKVLHAKGNAKLGGKFLVFSSLPGAAFCAGAGACLETCYSFKAWRYPAAFARQAQNSVLMQTAAGRELIAQQFARVKLPKKQKSMNFRLYVDGDYTNIEQFAFWCDTIAKRPEIVTYGYSKSLKIVADYARDNALPANYLLNLSGGHKYDAATEKAFLQLEIARGQFIAVGKKGNLKYDTPEYRAAAREAFARSGDTRKPFVCPGNCGTCTPKGHACGSKRFSDIPIVILTH